MRKTGSTCTRINWLDDAVSSEVAVGEATSVPLSFPMSMSDTYTDNCDESIVDTDMEENNSDISLYKAHESVTVTESSTQHHRFLHQDSQLSRASSTLSLSSSSSATVTDVRSLTSNYQKMLAQATTEIKKLNREKFHLEKEQEKLLTVNIELATEAKRLVKEVKLGDEEKKVKGLGCFNDIYSKLFQGLLAANEEFAEEVRRLYKEEETQEEEIKKIQENFALESKQLQEKLFHSENIWKEEKKMLENQRENLQTSIGVLLKDKDKLLEEIEVLQDNGKKSELVNIFPREGLGFN